MHSKENSTYSLAIECKDIQYLFENTEIKELNAIVLLENGPSNRVIQKSNFKFVGEIEIDAERNNHYRIHKKFLANPTFGVHEYKYVILTNANLKRGVWKP
ncbi:GNAT family N-acetyltransferase [Paenibacillus polymyxa]|uniref:GNAT family N-acetyltransferase n=1 Tax=Paenibacillus polymyxa TaxID=1406 RepID=UPI0025B64587|nr:GNAT family protein [Paenibacillus polymyxa]MDN4082644.1 GNAT family protein [Paenibacillus polymyxa]MDN4088485.1 GNAT family protein [Paenibacillus polymyxa]MDN4107935.1 GNAT family protein [Paenibacillus polymyxa]